ncbi:Heme oxygenase [Chitinophaga sp. CF118]|uniref:biliverdin-producing heme oxygenase n=1 Tax=Chitinophaga sp. CF118 TaxID=1884367 RepID=UPI0008E15026|nr:biliverdin-producing heme oxygenase [Chitinophaga sp. CF118]SFD18459.1 Heme oxygenase [Chitinophaga sp. CF118]
MMIKYIRESTETLYQELENIFISRIKQVSTPSEYMSLLQLFYGYYYPLEQHIAAHLDTSFSVGFEHRRKAPLLLQDMAVISGSPVEPSHLCTGIPEITDACQALGALYALERFALGGQAIARILTDNLLIPELPKAITFFEGYSSNTQTMWDSLVHYLDGYNGTDAQKARLIGTVEDTFLKFKLWAQSNI